MTRIKICGVTSEEEIRICVAPGAHALGFVVEYPIDVPWNLERQRAKDLMAAVPPFVSRVIVVGDDPRRVIDCTKLLKPHAVQLHGNEPLVVTKELVVAIHRLGAQVLKPLRFSVETGKCRSECEDPVEAARLIEMTGADALVLDSVSEARPAGTGSSVDWSLARKIRESLRMPVILAGGLNTGNVAQAVMAVLPYGVDVISGVEDASGRKVPEKIRAFIEAVTTAPHSP